MLHCRVLFLSPATSAADHQNLCLRARPVTLGSPSVLGQRIKLWRVPCDGVCVECAAVAGRTQRILRQDGSRRSSSAVHAQAVFVLFDVQTARATKQRTFAR